MSRTAAKARASQPEATPRQVADQLSSLRADFQRGISALTQTSPETALHGVERLEGFVVDGVRVSASTSLMSRMVPVVKKATSDYSAEVMVSTNGDVDLKLYLREPDIVDGAFCIGTTAASWRELRSVFLGIVREADRLQGILLGVQEHEYPQES